MPAWRPAHQYEAAYRWGLPAWGPAYQYAHHDGCRIDGVGLFLLTAAAIAAIMLAMAVGLLFRYPCLRGSCGGEDVLDAQGESLRCAACPKRRVTTD